MQKNKHYKRKNKNWKKLNKVFKLNPNGRENPLNIHYSLKFLALIKLKLETLFSLHARVVRF